MDNSPPADGPHYPDITIRGFRCFNDLHVPRLGRVTLITGKNNTGKSSLLEALHLHSHNGALDVMHHILRVREEAHRGLGEDERSSALDDLFQASALFSGFPLLSDDFEPIAIATDGKSGPAELSIQVDWFAEERDVEGQSRLVPRQQTLFGDSEYTPVLVVQTEETRRVHLLESLRSRPFGRRRVEVRMPCIPVSPYVGERTDRLDHLWSQVALTDTEREAVEALRMIDSGIVGVSMVATDGSLEGRRAIVRSTAFSRPVPLRSFGDGMHRLFAIVLSLVNARGGVLLIDEFENGLHHTAQLDAWRMIFRLARDLDVQVFATTHSWDAVEAFQKAAAEVPDEGVLLRLIRKGDDIIPTVFAEDDLAIVARHRIEVR